MHTLQAALRALAAVSVLLLIAAAPPEPEGLWTGPMVSDTPATLQGAKVVDAEGVKTLMDERPVLVDSGPADRKPDNLPATTLWRPTHRSIPGALWFPGAGRGDLDPAKAAAMLERIAEVSGGDKARPVVTFCKPRCWGSWNVGKRLVAAGYTSVYWFPGGLAAWQEKFDTAVVAPQPGWAADPLAPKPQPTAKIAP
ncbi:PQQ-dependent catabolism-associated CXXCW motif protein [Rhodoligotrophos appendicifer]|uniref:rhodanese-like domain-containing protein n=1 Tax=Rhodoligotrophos appendicifer TaxID=987056 RepID=UPI001184E473|nr:rhodanese-like domain-containing protein [Rhodoligotrophos appendicifer]